MISGTSGVYVVTGGGSGLGLATVEHLISQGHSVAVFDLKVDNVKDLGDKKFTKIAVDVSKKDNVEAALGEVVKKFGRIDGVINCAGIVSVGLLSNPKKHYEASETEFTKVFNINVLGTFLVTKSYVDLAVKNKWPKGVIVNVSSIAAEDGQNGQTIYSATKGAVNAMTLPMARELGKYNIRVVCIMPGPILTEMAKKLSPKVIEGLKKSSPLNRIGDPKQFASFVDQILQNEFLTGCNLRLDGGIRAPLL
jgi:NAD(P)-dependent dehydrogenase (short-subunit alcohol dehydrogenase family)